MAPVPVVYQTTHRIKFSDLDPYNHMHTSVYAGYFVDHRMEGLRTKAGWDLKTLARLPFMTWVKRMAIDFLQPAMGDQQVTITSFVREFEGAEAHIECTMLDAGGRALSRCQMTVACVDRATNRSMDWPPDAAALFFEPPSSQG